MRALLISVLSLSLVACGKNDQAANNENVADSLTADSIVSNDVTAIDAVTGDAANMAADVDMNFGNLGPQGQGVESNKVSSKQDRLASNKTESVSPEASNSVANATGNSE